MASGSNVARMSDPERERLLRKVDELYDGYGRGADGMLLPYGTYCYKAVVRAAAQDDPDGPDGAADLAPGPVESDGTDPDALLIDFS